MNRSRYFASVTLLLLSLIGSSFAASHSLSLPRGLAVDYKGDLWVANSGKNNVVAFGPNYKLIVADTITQNVINPTGVAFDPLGNLWVANYGTSNGGQNGSVAEYVAGQQNTAASIVNGILAPGAIAIDGVGDIFVENDFTNVTVYQSNSLYTPPSVLARTISNGAPIYGINAGAETLSWGSNTGTSFIALTPFLASGAYSGGSYGNDTGFALASDATGNVYMGNLDGSLNVASPLGYEYGPFAQLPFTPAGIAVDSVRGRVYFSNENGNEILVYSTAGALLHTIK